MSIAKKHIQHLETLKGSIEEFAKKIVIKNMDAIISVLQDKQLGIGQDSSGSALTAKGYDGTYSQNTQRRAAQEFTVMPKSAGSLYNFQWSGSFFDNMGLKLLSQNNYSIFSADAKSRLLRKTYGVILELTEKNNDLINETIIEPELVKHIEENWWRF